MALPAPEIDELYMTLLVQKNIPRLKVSMNESDFVEGLER
jgi:hypothetical protein